MEEGNFRVITLNQNGGRTHACTLVQDFCCKQTWFDSLINNMLPGEHRITLLQAHLK